MRGSLLRTFSLSLSSYRCCPLTFVRRKSSRLCLLSANVSPFFHRSSSVYQSKRWYLPPTIDELCHTQTTLCGQRLENSLVTANASAVGNTGSSSSPSSAGSSGSLKVFADFFRFPPPTKKIGKKKLEGEWRELMKDVISKDDEANAAAKLRPFSNEECNTFTERKDLPVFIVGYDKSSSGLHSSSTLHLFSLSSNVMVGRYTIKEIRSDFWEHAGHILRYICNSSRRFILLPLVQKKEDRKRVQIPVELLVKALKSCGLQPLFSVDTLTLEDFVSVKRNGSSVSTAVTSDSSSKSIGVSEPITSEVLEKYWSNLCARLCQNIEDDPLSIINTYVAPQYDVFVTHIVRTGSQGLSISLWNPQWKRRYCSKGMLSDILACLLQTGSSSMILIPTARTDRTLLYQCRAALTRVGKTSVLCFGTAVHEKCRGVCYSDPVQLWGSMVEIFDSLEANLFCRIYECAGDSLREYYKKIWSDEGIQSYVEKNVEASALPTPSDVKQWQQIFELPQRVVSEVKETKYYQKFIVFSYTSTEHTVFCQPRCPLAEDNYVIAASICDHRGRLVEPWVKYTSRQEGFRLPSLDGYDVLVAHDAKRFLLLCSGDPEIKKFIFRGGRVWCVMLAEYLLDAMSCTTGNNSLREISLRHGVVLPPSKVVGTDGESMSLAFHRRHLLHAAPVVQKIFLTQLRRAQEQMQIVSISQRMDSLLAMMDMEKRGICIDVEEANRQNTDLKNSLKVLDHNLSAYVPAEVPVDLRSRFDWTSPLHLHALFFGGTIQLGDHGLHRARETVSWLSNLMHLLYRFSQFDRLNGEPLLGNYAMLMNLPSTNANTKLSVRIGKRLEQEDNAKEKKFRVVIMDIETTGLNACTDEIIEVALYDPVENSSFCSLVRPQRRITPRTIEIHHISEDAVRTAPPPAVVMKGVANFLRLQPEKRDPHEILVVIGHNVFSLDEPLLRRALNRFTGDISLTDGILFCDSLALLRGLKLNLQRKQGRRGRRTSRRLDRRVLEALTDSLRLSKLMESLGVVAEGELHRAETDTRALWNVLMDAFGLSKRGVEEQCVELLRHAANSFFKFPSVGAFAPQVRVSATTQATLSGIAKQHIENGRALNSLRKKHISDEVLLALHTHGVELAGVLLKRQRMERMTPRFLDPQGDGHNSTMHPDKCIRQHIDMTSTVTSRTSSAYPSCQNISKDGHTRRLFVSRFGRAGCCVEVDYSQLEIVILAILSKDPKLVKDLKDGIDFHIKRAEFFSGIPYAQIEEGYRNGIPKFTKLRKMAKQFSFQRLYGAGVALLHKTTGIAIKELQQSIDLEEQEYPGISYYYRSVRAVALRPDNPGLPAGYIVELPTGCRIRFKTRDVVLNLPPVKNYPIQAYGAELSQMMLGQLYRHFVAKDFYKNRAFIVNFVHDSVWLDCHKDVVKQCVRDTKQIMGSVQEYVSAKFPGVDIPLKLKMSASCGENMQDVKPI